MSSLGIAAGLATAVLGAVTAVCFESAARRIGSLPVNILRLVVAALLFVGLSLPRTGYAVQPGLPLSAWTGLSLSGLLSVGALLGPFLGVSLGLLSAQLLPAGVASTLMSLVPVLLIPIAALFFRERITIIEIAGTAVAFAGVAALAI
jgi:drug/metabolite transporter (DMT)-like permease